MTEKLNTQQRMDKVVELIHEREKLQEDIYQMQKRNNEIGQEIYSLLQLWDDADPVAVKSNGEIYIVSPDGGGWNPCRTDVSVKNVHDMMFKHLAPKPLQQVYTEGFCTASSIYQET